MGKTILCNASCYGWEMKCHKANFHWQSFIKSCKFLLLECFLFVPVHVCKYVCDSVNVHLMCMYVCIVCMCAQMPLALQGSAMWSPIAPCKWYETLAWVEYENRSLFCVPKASLTASAQSSVIAGHLY